MRPVNLIPPDERQGDAAPLRTGSLIYVLVAGLALLLLGIIAVALTSKQISDRESQKSDLQAQLAQETARANSLAAFSSFRAVQQQRADTVSSLANSRFDWQRVLHELSLVLPSNISLTALTGTASPTVQLASSGGSSAAGSDLRAGIAGPALEISGCAPTQDAVAAFVASLKDIDGVTRVGLERSVVGGSGSSASSSSSSSSSDCGTPPDIYSFQITVAFDSVPTPPTATASPSVPPSVAPSTSGGTAQVASTQTPGS
jgi:Tfp pilus assembly protein PilN